MLLLFSALAAGCVQRPPEIVLLNDSRSQLRAEIVEGATLTIAGAVAGDAYRVTLDPGKEWRSRRPESKSQRVNGDHINAGGFPLFRFRKTDGTDRAWHAFEALTNEKVMYSVQEDAAGSLIMTAQSSSKSSSKLIRPSQTEWVDE